MRRSLIKYVKLNNDIKDRKFDNDNHDKYDQKTRKDKDKYYETMAGRTSDASLDTLDTGENSQRQRQSRQHTITARTVTLIDDDLSDDDEYEPSNADDPFRLLKQYIWDMFWVESQIRGAWTFSKLR